MIWSTEVCLLLVYSILDLERFKRIVSGFLMSMDNNLLKSVMAAQDQSTKYFLYINEHKYDVDSVRIIHSPTPVNSPTTRGGVYFSDTYAYKVKGIVRDLSVVPLLSKTMLGPSTDFGEIKISTQLDIDGKKQDIVLFTNLTNSMQTSSYVELNMILVNIESRSL
jgi:hypothetical protein